MHPSVKFLIGIIENGIPLSLEEEARCLPSTWCGKSITEATKLRNAGNLSYRSKNCDEAMIYYSRSVATAPTGSEELASAYGNRSAVLQFQNKHELCLLDSNRALKGTLTPRSRQLLLERRAISWEKLQEQNIMRSKLKEVSACNVCKKIHNYLGDRVITYDISVCCRLIGHFAFSVSRSERNQPKRF